MIDLTEKFLKSQKRERCMIEVASLSGGFIQEQWHPLWRLPWGLPEPALNIVSDVSG